MTFQVKQKKILVSLMARPNTKWREEIARLSNLGISELALFIDVFTLDQRKEVYRLLEASGIKSIPYVQMANNFEEGEIDFLVTTYKTEVFGLSLDNTSLALIASLTKYIALIAPENPANKKFAPLFTDEALSRLNIAGVCLDLTTIESDRLHAKKKYELEIHTLDHHVLLATQIGPISENFFKKSFQIKSRRLTSLADLHYLGHIPKAYLADLIVLELENSLEEQLEVKTYLEAWLK